jgi:hypothetical protein
VDERQAQESVSAVEQMWDFELGDSARKLWHNAMAPFDSVTVAGAILKLHDTRKERPRLNEFKAAVEEMTAAKETSLRAHPVARTVSDDPLDWIHVWNWLRFTNNDFRALPQQDYLGIVSGSSLEEMTMKEYEEVRRQWLAAGSPKVTLAQLVAGLTGSVRTTKGEK